MGTWNRLCIKHDYKSDDLFPNIIPLDLQLIKHKLNQGIVHLHAPKSGGTYLCHRMGRSLGKEVFHNAEHHGVCRGPFYPGICLDRGKKEGITKKEGCKETFQQSLYDKCIENTVASFSIIRNPYDVLTSKHFHQSKTPRENGWGDINTRLGVEVGHFDKFIRSYFDGPPLLELLVERKMYFFLPFDAKGNCLIDFFIRFEYLDEAMREISAHYGKKHKPGPPIKSSSDKKQNYKHYWTKELITWAEPYMRRQLDFFNYNFSGPLDDLPILDAAAFRYSPVTDEILF